MNVRMTFQNSNMPHRRSGDQPFDHLSQGFGFQPHRLAPSLERTSLRHDQRGIFCFFDH